MEVGLLLIAVDPVAALASAKAAEARGLDSVWSIDYYNRNSLVRAAAVAAATERITIGTAITPAFARAPLMTASAVADIDRICGGRFVLGLGTSTRRMNLDWFGAELTHPAPRLRELIELVRTLLAHQEGPLRYDGRFNHLSLAHFERHGDCSVPIYTAGVGPRMVELAGEVADGFVGHPAADLRYMRETARPGIAQGRDRRAPGAGDRPVRLALQVIAAVRDDPEQARRDVARQLGFYATVKGYDALFVHDDGVVDRAALRDAFAAGRLDDVERLAQPLTETRGLFGTAADVARQLGRYEDEVDLVLLYSPHYGVDDRDVARNELALIDAVARR